MLKKRMADRKQIDEILRTAVAEDDAKAVCRFFMEDDPYGDRARAVDAILKAVAPHTTSPPDQA